MRMPATPPDIGALLATVGKAGRLPEFVLGGGAARKARAATTGDYPHWHRLRRLPPPPELTSNEWWLALKLQRSFAMRELPLVDRAQRPFRYMIPDLALELVHFIDSQLSGRITVSEPVTDPATRDRYLVSSIMEEAITSSLLEGAATTYREAKDLLRTARKPRSVGERMVLNNYEAMQLVRTFKEKDLTISRILELHAAITRGTIDPEDAEGRLRRPDEDIKVGDELEGTIVHVPPHADELQDRVTMMCQFANEKIPDYYIHPVIRASILHFWLAYDHPFVDGNGRVARALFYWMMLKKDYWLVEFISISAVVRKAPTAYGLAFLESETDENDVTYFLIHQLKVIRRAIEGLEAYLKKKMKEVRTTEGLLRADVALNHRQIALLTHALRHSDEVYTVESHRRSHAVVYQTARTDLLDLVARGFLQKQRVSKRFVFTAAPNLSRLVSSGGKAVASRPRRRD